MDQDERLQEMVWKMLNSIAGVNHQRPANGVFTGLIIGIRLHSSDSDLANHMLKVMLSGGHGELLSNSDQFAAMMRKEFMEDD